MQNESFKANVRSMRTRSVPDAEYERINREVLLNKVEGLNNPPQVIVAKRLL